MHFIRLHNFKNIFLCCVPLLFHLMVVGQIHADDSFTKKTIDSNFSVYFIRAFDFDQDGDKDIISGMSSLAWWRNDGSGNFSRQTIDGSVTAMWSVFPVDMDGDGDYDLIISDSGNHNIAWYKNNGGGFRKYIIESNYINAESAAGADFDRDGDIDVVGLSWGTDTEPGKITLWSNRGNESFTRTELDNSFEAAHKLTVADMDYDGDIDIIACGSSSKSGLCWWRNDGHGNFDKRSISKKSGLGISLYDVDKNGALDIIYAKHGTGEVVLFLNNGSGSFSGRVVASQLSWPSFGAGGDFNNDGKVDIAVIARDSHELYWLENTGGLNFETRLIDSNVTRPFTVDAADFDQDGIDDIVTGSKDTKDLWWWKSGAGGSSNWITVISPNGGEEYLTGSQTEIRWNSSSTVQTVGIDYSYDQGSNWHEIINSTTSDGYYTWQLPSISSTDYLVRIKDKNSSTSDQSNNTFSIIQNTISSLILLSPNGGEILRVDDYIDISWQSEGNITDISLECSFDDGNSWNLISNSTTNDGNYNWNIPATISNECRIRISDNGSSISDLSDNTFSIIEPEFNTPNIIFPNGGERLLANTYQSIEWNPGNSYDSVKLEYSLNNGESWQLISSEVPNIGIFLWHIPQIDSENIRLKISIEENQQISDISDQVFSIQNYTNAGFALQFNGTDDVAKISNSSILSGGQDKSLSVEAWIMPFSTSANHPIISKFFDNNWKEWGLQIKNGALEVSIENDGDNWNFSAGQILPNVWSHVAFTFNNDANYIKIFINGEEAGISEPYIKNIPITAADVLLGSHIYAEDHFDGLIDEIRIWDIPRDESDIMATKNTILTGNELGLIGYWRFDEGMDQKAYDLSFNNNPLFLGTSNILDEFEPEWIQSDAPIFVNPIITLIQSNGDNIFYSGEILNIQWQSNENIDLISIEFSSDSGVTWEIIAEQIENEGTYLWEIPDVESNFCLIRIIPLANYYLPVTSNEHFSIQNRINLSGKFQYYGNLSPIPNVSINLKSDETISDSTDFNGFFEFQNINKNQGPYYLFPDTKIDYVQDKTCISSYDAVLTARHSIGLITLSENQSIAADVNNDSLIHSFDAVAIAQHAVGKTYIQNLHVGEWIFFPDSIFFDQLDADTHNVNFTGLIMGDVDDSWDSQDLSKINSEKEASIWISSYEYFTSNDTMCLVFNLCAQDSVLSYDIWISNFTNDYSFIKSEISPLNSSLVVFENIDNDVLKLAGYSVDYLNKDHKIKLYFKQKHEIPQNIIQINKFIINNQLLVSDQFVNVKDQNFDENVPSSFQLFQNFPNPFNSETLFQYHVAKPGKVKLLIHNLLGQVVKKFQLGYKGIGSYKTVWNGKNDLGQDLPGGVYLAQFYIGDSILGSIKLIYIP